MRQSLTEFTNLFPLSKTLQFELRPIGRTAEFIAERGFLKTDEERAEKYKKIKEIIDRYHKEFIERIFSVPFLKVVSDNKHDSLTEYRELFLSSQRDEKLFKKIKDNLRTVISKKFHDDEKFLVLLKNTKDLLKKDLYSLELSDEEKAIIKSFENFASYFTGFNENRENMYSKDEKSTAIAFRVIDQNLPKFLTNAGTVEKYPILISENFTKDIDPALFDYAKVSSCRELFDLAFFPNCLSQKGIEAYNNIINDLNRLVNLYNQRQSDRSAKLPRLLPLFKQILSDRLKELSFLPEQFQSDQEVLDSIESFKQNTEKLLTEAIPSLFFDLEQFDLNAIYVANGPDLTKLMQQTTKDWDTFHKLWIDEYSSAHIQGRRESSEKYLEKIEKEFRRHESFSLAEISQLCKNGDSDGQWEDPVKYLMGLSVMDSAGEKMSLLRRIDETYTAAENLLNTEWPVRKHLAKDEKAVELIRSYLDAVKELQHFLKLLSGAGSEPGRDAVFYGRYQTVMGEIDLITPLYNKVRNYVTKKPYSLEKYKLNFDCSSFLTGWDANKEKDYLGTLFRKDGLFYLGVINPQTRKIFEEETLPADGECYEKIVYKYLPSPIKMLPKVVFPKSNLNLFDPPPKVLKAYIAHRDDAKPYSKDELQDLIGFYQRVLHVHTDWKKFEFALPPADTYENIQDFCKDIADQGYRLFFRRISASYIDSLVDEGKLYLFKLWNKDFSERSTGTPNMHTLYWKALFDERNLADVVFKLNGEAELFYRKASIPEEEQVIHHKNEPIHRRRDNQKASLFPYDMIKDRRFTRDQYSFHVSLTINYKAAGKSKINEEVRNWICGAENMHVIGIDRGERNLIYLSVIDLQGRIVMQKSLNEIIEESRAGCRTTDYHALLADREKKRDEARKSWQSIENIKDLKGGYLSQVVHVLSELIIRYNAVVCLEDLNVRFMQGRQKVDKSVYQQFERKLTDKLCYLVDKKAAAESPLGVLKGIQLVQPDAKLSFQNGVIFYVPAWNTSKIDPVTGFVNLFDLRWQNIDKAKNFFSRFEKIAWNAAKHYFEFTFDYSKFSVRNSGGRSGWTVCTFGERIASCRDQQNRNQWLSRRIDLTEKMKAHFEKFNVALSCDMKQNILDVPTSQEFWKELLGLFRLTVQLRNSVSGSTAPQDDFILSPVCDEKGDFFDSRKIGDGSLPCDADANGAYNIARKGLYIIRKLKNSADPLAEKSTMTNNEWLDFAQR